MAAFASASERTSYAATSTCPGRRALFLTSSGTGPGGGQWVAGRQDSGPSSASSGDESRPRGGEDPPGGSALAAGVPTRRTVACSRSRSSRRLPVAPEATRQLDAAQSLYEPGKIERTLRGLGVTNIDLLRRGGEIDRAAELLITQAAAESESGPPDPSTAGRRPQAVAGNGLRHGRVSTNRRAGGGHSYAGTSTGSGS